MNVQQQSRRHEIADAKPVYRDREIDAADRVMDRGLALPTHQGMTAEDLEQGASALDEVLGAL